MKNRIESLMIKETTHNGNIIRRDLNLLTILTFYIWLFQKNNTQALQANFIYLFSRTRAKRVVTIDCKEIPK